MFQFQWIYQAFPDSNFLFYILVIITDKTNILLQYIRQQSNHVKVTQKFSVIDHYQIGFNVH